MAFPIDFSVRSILADGNRTRVHQNRGAVTSRCATPQKYEQGTAKQAYGSQKFLAKEQTAGTGIEPSTTKTAAASPTAAPSRRGPGASQKFSNKYIGSMIRC